MKKSIVLSLAYLAPIDYYSLMYNNSEVWIEAHENYSKQSYRNRCKIYGANGSMFISIPVNKLENKIPIRDLLIDYSTRWQKLHWKSIESAYRSSPFFEFYEDYFKPFYEKKYKYLFDFNIEIQSMILDQLDLDLTINYTSDFKNEYSDPFLDLRNEIHPKKNLNNTNFNMKEYTQVFMEKHGFIPNLSIIDLLFNEGPHSDEILSLSY